MKTHVLSVALALIGLATAFVGLPLSQATWPGQAEVQPDDKEIERLVKQLGSDKLKEREAATKRLMEIGEPALDALQRGADIAVAIENKLYVQQLALTGHASSTYSERIDANAVWVRSVSADGKRLLTCGVDKTLRLWDTHTGKQLRVFEGHTADVRGAALSPDGKCVLSGSSDNTVRLWDATTGKELRKYEGHTAAVMSVAFGPEGKAISGSFDRTMILWDLNTGEKVGVFTGHTNYLTGVAYSDKAKLAATCSHDTSIRLWNLETGKEVCKPTDNSYGTSFASICFSADGKRLVSASYADEVRIWDVKAGKQLKIINVRNPVCAAFSPDGKRIVTGGYHDHTVRVLDVETGKELRKYEGHGGVVTSVAYFPDGKRIASASYDRTARVWRAPR